MRFRPLLLLVPFLPLAGCASPPMITAAGTPVHHYVPDLIDGSYQGTVHLTSAPGRSLRFFWRAPGIADSICPGTTTGVIEIDARIMTYAFNPDLIFTPTVAADGSIYQKLGDATLWGSVGRNRLRFNVSTPVCTARFFGDYKLNHSY